MKRILLILLLLPALAWGQVEDSWQQYLEDWAEQNDAESLPDELVELIEGFLEVPFNLNDTASSRLLELPIVSEFQWQCVKAYVRMNGEMLSANELHLVNGFDSTTIQLLRPLVVATPGGHSKAPSLEQMLTQGHSNLVMGARRQMELSRGYTDTLYAGSPYRLYFRYYYKYGDHLHLQLSGDKDPGEQFFQGTQPQGFDHYGGYLMLNDMGRLRRLVVGHYNLQFGQGLTLWSGYSPWAGYDANQRRYGQGIRGAGAMAEYGYLQGVATTVGLLKHWEITAFVSHQSLDATPSSVDSMAVQSLYNSGYHRTENELNKRDLLSESLYGAHLGYQREGLSLGLTAYHSHYSRPILPKEYVYNYFYFSGQDNSLVGLDAAYRHHRLTLFGELSASMPQGFLSARTAALAGLQLDLNGDNRFGVTFRSYKAGYQNLHNTPLSQSGSAPEEQGTLITFQTKLPGSIVAVASTDLFRHPYVHYNAYASTLGADTRLRLARDWGKKLSLTAQYRYKSKEANASLTHVQDSSLLEEHSYIVEQTLRQQLQLRCDYGFADTWRFSSRVVLTQASCEYHALQNGLLLLQDVSFNRPRITLAARCAYFHTDGYDSRVYAMESDFLYEFATPSLQGQGYRTYLVLRWRPSNTFTLSAKYALTAYTDGRESIGSGYDVTQGPLRREIKLQLHVRF